MKFSTVMFQDGKNTGIEVPAEVVDSLKAGQRPPVVVTVNGYEYRSTIAVMGGRYLLPFSAKRRQQSGISGGDAIDVEVRLDHAPRVVDVPEDLRSSIDGAGLAAAWDKLAPSAKKAHVANVVEAKTAETRARRIIAILVKLGG